LNFYREVHEGDLVYRVNLSDYLDTGLFLDARKKRTLIRADAAGKRVLNLFAYTCSLSVCAAKGSASQVDSVDLSNTYLEWGRINFALNGLQAHDVVESGSFTLGSSALSGLNLIRGDVLQFINHARKNGLRWDLIILDPPSFSNSKKMRDMLDLRRDHLELIRKGLSLLSPGGTLWFSTNAKGVKIDAEDFPDVELKDMGKGLVDEDFRGKKVPMCYTLTL